MNYEVVDTLISPEGRLEVLSKAEDVLGSRADAEQWLAARAIGLNSRRPIELLATPQGAELVKTLLDQMAHGVYA